MSDAAPAPAAPAPADTGGAAESFTPSQFGTKAELHQAIWGDIDPGDDGDAAATVDSVVGDEVAAKREAKAKPEPEAKVDDDVATVRAIEARAKARRKAANDARRTREAAAAPAQATPQAQAQAAPVAQARPDGPVESAVKDVLAQLARLERADADAAAQTGAAAPDNAERQAAHAAITARLDAIQGALKQTEAGQTKLSEMEAKLQSIESERTIRHHVSRLIEPVLDELPLLTDPKALRAFNKEHGTAFADSVEMISEAAARYFEKFKAPPDMAELAKRIERKLKGASPEQTEADEKPTPKSKTVSRHDGSPPAARQDPDERSFEEAQADFNRRLGIG